MYIGLVDCCVKYLLSFAEREKNGIEVTDKATPDPTGIPTMDPIVMDVTTFVSSKFSSLSIVSSIIPSSSPV